MIAAQTRVIEITKLAQDPAQLKALRAHLEEVIHGEVFGGSPRGQQFLRHVVEKTIAGDLDSLKERVIGIELFHRSPSYNKSEDAIVRVTASDVRKRLLQHYTEHGNKTGFRIDIQPGSYIPEVLWASSNGSAAASTAGSAATAPLEPVPSAPERAKNLRSLIHTKGAILSVSSILGLLTLAFWAGYATHKPDAQKDFRSLLPWASILGTGRELRIVPSDADFATEQDITKHAISLSDYANEKYLPDGTELSPEVRSFCLKYLRGTRTADIDLPIVANIVSLVRPAGKRVQIRSARQMRTGDFQSDDDFVLLGSPVANPWLEMFEPQLDFRFIFTNETTLQSIENVRPRGNELKLYTPQGGGFDVKPATGVAYAIVGFVQNPHKSGHVLILAGTGAEGTWAASQLVMNPTDLANTLRACDRKQNEPLQNFEILLKVNMMAGSPTNTELVACHRLPGA